MIAIVPFEAASPLTAAGLRDDTAATDAVAAIVTLAKAVSTSDTSSGRGQLRMVFILTSASYPPGNSSGRPEQSSAFESIQPPSEKGMTAGLDRGESREPADVDNVIA